MKKIMQETVDREVVRVMRSKVLKPLREFDEMAENGVVKSSYSLSSDYTFLAEDLLKGADYDLNNLHNERPVFAKVFRQIDKGVEHLIMATKHRGKVQVKNAVVDVVY